MRKVMLLWCVKSNVGEGCNRCNHTTAGDWQTKGRCRVAETGSRWCTERRVRDLWIPLARKSFQSGMNYSCNISEIYVLVNVAWCDGATDEASDSRFTGCGNVGSASSSCSLLYSNSRQVASVIKQYNSAKSCEGDYRPSRDCWHLPPDLWLTSFMGCLLAIGISSGT